MFNAPAAAAKIAALNPEHIHTRQGGFMDLLGPGSPPIDYNKRTVTFWGDGTPPIEVTSVDDTARMTAPWRSIAPSRAANADITEAQTGKRFARRSLGSEADLRAAMAAAAKTDPFHAATLAYRFYELNSRTALEDLPHKRYPDLKPQCFAEFLAGRLCARSAVHSPPPGSSRRRWVVGVTSAPYR
jgi:hypothetical protein